MLFNPPSTGIHPQPLQPRSLVEQFLLIRVSQPALALHLCLRQEPRRPLTVYQSIAPTPADPKANYLSAFVAASHSYSLRQSASS